MGIRLGIAGAIWAAILVVAVQLVPTPALAHSGHVHHAGDVAALAHHAGAGSFDHKAASRPAPSSFQAASISAMPDHPQAADFATACTGGCCGTGASCCGAVMVGSIAELPDIGTAIRMAVRVVDRRSGIDPDGLARPPRILAA